MSNSSADFAVLHPDGRVVYGHRHHDEKIASAVLRHLTGSLDNDFTAHPTPLRRTGVEGPPDMWCVGVDLLAPGTHKRAANEMADHVLDRVVGTRRALDARESWRGPVVLHMKHDRRTGAVPTLDDSGVRELIDVAAQTYRQERHSLESLSRADESTRGRQSDTSRQRTQAGMSTLDPTQLDDGLAAAASTRRPVGVRAAALDADPAPTAATDSTVTADAGLAAGCD